MTRLKPRTDMVESHAVGPLGFPQPFAAPRTAPTITFSTDGFLTAHWRGIGIAVWARQATAELVQELDALAKVVGSTALQLLLKRDVKLKTFGDIDALARWVVPIHGRAVGEAIDVAEFIAVLELLLDHQLVRR